MSSAGLSRSRAFLGAPAALALCLLWLHAPGAPAQPAPPQPAKAGGPDYGTPQEQAERFLDALGKGAAVEAMEELLKRNPFFDGAAVEKGAAAVRQLAGASLFLDYEPVTIESITPRYTTLVYILHFERQPILFDIRFYNPATRTWLVHSWNFSANTEDIVAAVRAARQREGTPSAGKAPAKAAPKGEAGKQAQP